MPEFNRFDICEAYYLFASEYHSGQWSKEYQIFGRLNNIQFKCRDFLRSRDDLSENSQLIYDNLVSKNSY
jgi:hypothetical protein